MYGCKMFIPGFSCYDQNSLTDSDSQCTVGSYYCGTLSGYCLSNYNSQPVIGRCLLLRSNDINCYHNVCMHDITDLIFCAESDGNSYTGRLNDACKSNNCVTINSPYFECTDVGIVINLLIVFTIEIVLVTTLVILIIVLNIKLTMVH